MSSCLKGPRIGFSGSKKMALKKSKLNLCLALTILIACASTFAQTAPGVSIGTVKSISGNSIVLTPDSGDAINVTVQDSARLLRIAPGETDLKKAVPIALTDVQAEDRIRVRGTLASDGKTILAVSVIAIKKEDV